MTYPPPSRPDSTDDLSLMELLRRRFARTYHLEGYDPWERAQQYEAFVAYVAANPNDGSSAVASALDAPRGRIRPWMDKGARPDVVKGLEAAGDRGWFDLADNEEALRGLTICLAWIYSSGSIAESTYSPVFIATTDDQLDRLIHALDLLDLDYTVDDRQSPEQSRARQVTVREHATVLGRMLATLDAPVGEKNEHSNVELPALLDTASADIELVWLATYTRNRVGGRMRCGSGVLMREQRSKQYLDALAARIESATGAKASRSDLNIWLSAGAVEALLDVSLQ